MLKQTLKPFCAVLLASLLLMSAAAQNRPQDRVTIDQKIQFQRGRSSAIINKKIRLGQTHLYRLTAREGQAMTLTLITKGRTSFTLFAPGGVVEEADGVKRWEGLLAESGEYLIEIGTDTTTSYTLEVIIK